LRTGATAAELFLKTERKENPRAIRADLDAGTYLAEARRLLINVNVDTSPNSASAAVKPPIPPPITTTLRLRPVISAPQTFRSPCFDTRELHRLRPFSVSAAINAPNSSSVLTTKVPPRSAIWALRLA
jgi:hypothetical protein